MSTPPIRTDRDLSGDIRQQFSELLSKNRPIAQFSNTLGLFLLQAISFSVKVFIRQNPGRLTYSLMTIVMAYFWVRYFMGGDVDFLRNGVPKIYLFDVSHFFNSIQSGKFQPAPQPKVDTSALAYLFGLLILALEQIGVLFQQGLQWKPPLEVRFLIVYWYSYLVVLRGLHILVQSGTGYQKRDEFDPLDRGESIPWGWLEGRSIGNFKIKRHFILMWIDPASVILMGLLVWLFTGNFGIFFMCSGLVLFFEERAVRFRDQKAVLIKLASEKWTERIMTEYQEFKDDAGTRSGGGFAQASFADNQEQQSEQSNEPEQKATGGGKASFS